jgi:hypothetical protein
MAQIFQTVDDLHQAEDGEQVTADRTHQLALDGRTVEIDLTAAHYDELAKLLSRYFAAGRKGPGGDRTPGGRRPGSGRATGSYNAGMRAYADAHGISYRTQAHGKPSYNVGLRRAYAALTDEERAKWNVEAVKAGIR